MTNQPLTYIDLERGLRLVHLHVPRLKVGYSGVAIRAGSRDENVDAHLDGLAHFVEHTIFKGTAKRSSWHIINRMEAVGGELNAFTTKEDTVVYTVFPGANPSRALELIADLVFNSRFPNKELDKERQVVAEEINTYLDIPGEAILDDFEDVLFKHTSLGHNILGTTKSLATFDSALCRAWLDTYYHRDRMVVFYAGAMSASRVADMVNRYFTGDNIQVLTLPPAPVDHFVDEPPRHVVRHIRGSHQAHMVIGNRLKAGDSAHRVRHALLTNILGGPGMNSRLNVMMRERRGLVYNVEASTSFFRDSGFFSIYYGCDPEHNDKCRDIALEVLDDMAAHPLAPRALSMAKKQYLGQLTVATQNIENHIISIARATLLRGHAMSDRELRDLLSAITPEDLAQTASGLLAPTTLTFIP